MLKLKQIYIKSTKDRRSNSTTSNTYVLKILGIINRCSLLDYQFNGFSNSMMRQFLNSSVLFSVTYISSPYLVRLSV